MSDKFKYELCFDPNAFLERRLFPELGQVDKTNIFPGHPFVRPFVAPCKRSFRREGLMQNHVWIAHLGKKRFKSTPCRKRLRPNLSNTTLPPPLTENRRFSFDIPPQRTFNNSASSKGSWLRGFPEENPDITEEASSQSHHVEIQNQCEEVISVPPAPRCPEASGQCQREEVISVPPAPRCPFPNIYKCQHCGSAYPSRFNRNRHEKSCGQIFVCAICGNDYPSKLQYRRHMEYERTKAKKNIE